MTTIQLKPTTTAPDPKTIDILKHALEKAETGELRDIAVCGNCIGGDVYYSYATQDHMLLVAQLAKMQHMILHNSFRDAE